MEICIAAAAILQEDRATLLVRKLGTSAFMQPGGKIDGDEPPVVTLRRADRKHDARPVPQWGMTWVFRAEPLT